MEKKSLYVFTMFHGFFAWFTPATKHLVILSMVDDSCQKHRKITQLGNSCSGLGYSDSYCHLDLPVYSWISANLVNKLNIGLYTHLDLCLPSSCFACTIAEGCQGHCLRLVLWLQCLNCVTGCFDLVSSNKQCYGVRMTSCSGYCWYL